MKIKLLQELRVKESKELVSMLSDKREELEKVKLELNLGKIKNVHIAKNLRRDIAQVLTIIRERGDMR